MLDVKLYLKFKSAIKKLEFLLKKKKKTDLGFTGPKRRHSFDYVAIAYQPLTALEQWRSL